MQEAGQAEAGASRGGEELKGAYISSQLKGAEGLKDEVKDERIVGGGEALRGEELKGAAEVKDERIVIVVTVVYNNVVMLQKQVLKCS